MLVFLWPSTATVVHAFDFCLFSLETWVSEQLQICHFFVRIIRHWFLLKTFWVNSLQNIGKFSDGWYKLKKIRPERLNNISYWHTLELTSFPALPAKTKLSERNPRQKCFANNCPTRQRLSWWGTRLFCRTNLRRSQTYCKSCFQKLIPISV